MYENIVTAQYLNHPRTNDFVWNFEFSRFSRLNLIESKSFFSNDRGLHISDSQGLVMLKCTLLLLQKV